MESNDGIIFGCINMSNRQSVFPRGEICIYRKVPLMYVSSVLFIFHSSKYRKDVSRHKKISITSNKWIFPVVQRAFSCIHRSLSLFSFLLFFWYCVPYVKRTLICIFLFLSFSLLSFLERPSRVCLGTYNAHDKLWSWRRRKLGLKKNKKNKKMKKKIQKLIRKKN